MVGWIALPDTQNNIMNFTRSIIYSGTTDIDLLRSSLKHPDMCLSIQDYEKQGILHDHFRLYFCKGIYKLLSMASARDFPVLNQSNFVNEAMMVSA